MHTIYNRTMRTLALFQELDTPDYKAFVLRNVERSTCVNSCTIVFTPVGVAILGDLVPGENGVVSRTYLSVEWFAGQLSQDYLCSKFLPKQWHHELARDEVDQMIYDVQARADEAEAAIEEAVDRSEGLIYVNIDAERGATLIEELETLSYKLDCCEIGEEGLHDALHELDIPTDDGIPGYGYSPREVEILVAIQQRFAELYHTDLRRADGP